MAERNPRSALTSAVCYQDPKAAIRWLEAAFGFEPLMVILDAQENLTHSELRFGDSTLMVAPEWTPAPTSPQKSPMTIGGVNTQAIHVQVEDGLDAHCERARRAGARILQEPETQFYGDRTYRAMDPEGHLWSFGMTVTTMTPEEWDKVSGLTTRARL
jgi:uncharacterized glyoxalase superfamily protein PhnB